MKHRWPKAPERRAEAVEQAERVLWCGATHKRVFSSSQTAWVRAGEILTEGARGADEFRAYKCIYCGGYHLTSKHYENRSVL